MHGLMRLLFQFDRFLIGHDFLRFRDFAEVGDFGILSWLLFRCSLLRCRLFNAGTFRGLLGIFLLLVGLEDVREFRPLAGGVGKSCVRRVLSITIVARRRREHPSLGQRLMLLRRTNDNGDWTLFTLDTLDVGGIAFVKYWF